MPIKKLQTWKEADLADRLRVFEDEILAEALVESEEEMPETSRFDASDRAAYVRAAREAYAMALRSVLTRDRTHAPDPIASGEGDASIDPTREGGPIPNRAVSLSVREAGLFSYTTGILGAAAFMALAIGPGWLGFLIGLLPASAIAAWAVTEYA